MPSFSETINVPPSEKGVAMVEFGLVVVGMVVGLLLTVDVSLAVSQYMLISQAGYEGLKLGNRLPEMEVSPTGGYNNVEMSETERDQCNDGVPMPGGKPCQHFLIHQRIRDALDNIRLFDNFGISGAAPSIRSDYIPSTAGVGAGDDTITVEVRSIYDGFFLPRIPLAIGIQATYLYQEL